MGSLVPSAARWENRHSRGPAAARTGLSASEQWNTLTWMEKGPRHLSSWRRGPLLSTPSNTSSSCLDRLLQRLARCRLPGTPAQVRPLTLTAPAVTVPATPEHRILPESFAKTRTIVSSSLDIQTHTARSRNTHRFHFCSFSTQDFFQKAVLQQKSFLTCRQGYSSESRP